MAQGLPDDLGIGEECEQDHGNGPPTWRCAAGRRRAAGTRRRLASTRSSSAALPADQGVNQLAGTTKTSAESLAEPSGPNPTNNLLVTSVSGSTSRSAAAWAGTRPGCAECIAPARTWNDLGATARMRSAPISANEAARLLCVTHPSGIDSVIPRIASIYRRPCCSRPSSARPQSDSCGGRRSEPDHLPSGQVLGRLLSTPPRLPCSGGEPPGLTASAR